MEETHSAERNASLCRGGKLGFFIFFVTLFLDFADKVGHIGFVVNSDYLLSQHDKISGFKEDRTEGMISPMAVVDFGAGWAGRTRKVVPRKELP